MKIYIPKHIRSIGVVSKMCDLIEGYSNNPNYAVDNSINSFNSYYYYLNTDPVVRFLHFCIRESDWEIEHYGENGDKEDYDSAIAYIARLFYSVKGTYQVFEFMKRYLDLNIQEIDYTVKRLSFIIPVINLYDVDQKVWSDALLDFLNALLYFGHLNVRIERLNLYISNTLRNYVGVNIVTYKEYTTVRYENL